MEIPGSLDKINITNLTTDFLRGYYVVIEQTLLFHLWLKKDKYLKSDFEIENGNVDSRAMKRIKHYLEHFKTQIIRNLNIFAFMVLYNN